METKPIDVIVWDLETTGFIAPEARILEIGAFIIRGEDVEHKHWVINEGIEIPEKIIEITGITKEIIEAEGRNAEECLREFIPLLMESKKNVTHNGIKFDIPFLSAYAHDVLKPAVQQTADLVTHLRNTSFDTAVHFKAKKLPTTQGSAEKFIDFAERVMSQRVFGLKFNLKLCCEESKVDMTNITLHRAMADVAMTHELYKIIHKDNG